jgi:predicted RNA-binding Zn-ribbon protein involved in translation (DUF1610 family)
MNIEGEMQSDRIKQWHPFLYRYINYMGTPREVTFTCPTCGGHNCEKIDRLESDNFWSGHFRCTDCGEKKEKGEPLCYFSDAFINKPQRQAVQLELF